MRGIVLDIEEELETLCIFSDFEKEWILNQLEKKIED